MVDGLTVKPAAEDWRLAREVHALFRAKPGSRHIATEFALAHLAALLRQHPVKSVLEFGSGIGTITHLLLKLVPADARIMCAERNEWCRQQFDLNIPAHERSRAELIPAGRPMISATFDLIIIDGPVSPEASYVREGSLCFVEGNRTDPWSTFTAGLNARGLACQRTHYPARGYRIRWRMSRLGISLPRIRPAKGCWIGCVQSVSDAAASDRDGEQIRRARLG